METRSLPTALCICIFCIIVHTERVSYTGYQVFEIKVTGSGDWAMLEEFIENDTHKIDVWKRPMRVGDAFIVLIEPTAIGAWRNLCRDKRLICSVMISNVQKLIDEEMATQERVSSRHKRDEENILYRLVNIYPTWEEIEQWLIDLDRAEPLVSLLNLGQTYENRTLFVLKITAAERADRVPAIWVDGGIHAREWIVHTSMIYTIRNLIEGYYKNNTDVRHLVEEMVWYIMPVVNPDGYEYSHKVDRFWRKNRSPPPKHKRDGYDNTTCLGVDLNRNFNISWGKVDVSTNSCYIVYPGDKPASELETQAITEFVQSKADRIFGFLSIHSFGQLVLSRWAYVNDTPPDNAELMQLAKETAATMTAVNDLEFLYGISPRLLYSYSGGSADWAKAVAGIKYSYTMELRDLGVFGFVLPRSHIRPAGEEFFRGLLTMANRIKEYGENVTASPEAEGTTELPATTSSTTAATTIVASSTTTTTTTTSTTTTAAISKTKRMTNINRSSSLRCFQMSVLLCLACYVVVC